jgi:hypothetical protein
MPRALRLALAAGLAAGALASPLAAQAGSAPDLLLAEGIVAPPPPGFPPFERYRGNRVVPGIRTYRSRTGIRMIMVTVVDPPARWRGDDTRLRQDHFQVSIEAFTGPAIRPPVITRHEDPQYLVATVRAVLEPYASNAVARVYLPRTGAPRAVGIQVMNVWGEADPADDPDVMAFLDAARPRVDESWRR